MGNNKELQKKLRKTVKGNKASYMLLTENPTNGNINVVAKGDAEKLLDGVIPSIEKFLSAINDNIVFMDYHNKLSECLRITAQKRIKVLYPKTDGGDKE